MRKWIAMLALLVLMLALTACGTEAEAEALVITRGTEETLAAEEENAVADEAWTEYCFLADGVELVPGAAFDPAVLPEAASLYTVPSCAIEGTDNVYNYEAFEITAYDDGTGEVIYSIYIIDPNTATPEGLVLGDSLERVLELYGEDYERNGTAYDFYGSKTMLSILVQNDAVVSIEYRMITE